MRTDTIDVFPYLLIIAFWIFIMKCQTLVNCV